MSRFTLLILLSVAALLQMGLVVARGVPLGIPGEWVWSRIPAGNLNWLALFFAVTALLIYTGAVIFRDPRLKNAAAEEAAGKAASQAFRPAFPWRGLLVLWLLGTVTLLTMRNIPDGIYGQAGLNWVTYYPRMTGYFTQATEVTSPLGEYLAGYEEAVRQGDYLHQGTHPPGLPLYFLGWLTVCEQVPAVTSLLLATEPLDVAAGTDVLKDLALRTGKPFPDHYRAVLWGHLLLTSLLCVATIFPLYGLLTLHCSGRNSSGLGTNNRQLASRQIAWWLVALWPLCPALNLFLPKDDLLLPFFCTATIYCYQFALSKPARVPQLGWALLAGLLAWVCLMISLASLVIIAILGLSTACRLFLAVTKETGPDETVTREPEAGQGATTFALRWNPRFWQQMPWLVVAAAILGVLLPSLLLWFVFDANLFAIWAVNLSKHGEFYDHNPRTYWLWLLVNPLELLLSLGAPVGLLAVLGGVGLLRRRCWNAQELLSLSVLAVWALLWISGKNMGEAARLWIFLYPCFFLVAAHGPELLRPAASSGERRFPWKAFLLAQILVASFTITSLDGFDFSYFLTPNQ